MRDEIRQAELRRAEYHLRSGLSPESVGLLLLYEGHDVPQALIEQMHYRMRSPAHAAVIERMERAA